MTNLIRNSTTRITLVKNKPQVITSHLGKRDVEDRKS